MWGRAMPVTWPQEHPGEPQQDARTGLYRLCGALPPGAEDGDCCALPLGHSEPHDTDPAEFEAWKAAHQP